MRKTFTTFAKVAMGLLLLSGSALTANAAAIGEDLKTDKGAAEAGQSYEVTYGDYYTYSVSKDTSIEIEITSSSSISKFYWSKNPFFFYYQNSDYYAQQSFIEVSGNTFTFSLKADTEYVICYGADLEGELGQNASFSFEIKAGEVELPAQGLSSVYPEPGETPFDYNTYPDITVRATVAIESFGSATFSYGSESVEIDDMVQFNGNPQFIQIGGASTNFATLVDQAAQEGEEFTIELTEVMAGGVLLTTNALSSNSNVTVEDGTVTLTYKITPAPQYLSDQSTWPNTVYTNWPSGTSSKATLKFSSDVTAVESVTVTMGAVTNGGSSGETQYASVELTSNNYSFSEDEMTIDFSGISYPSSSTSKITVIIKNVTNEAGLPANFGDDGTALYQQLNFSNNSGTTTEPSYMTGEAKLLTSELPFSDPMEAVELEWPETVTLVDDTAVIQVSCDGSNVGSLTMDFVGLYPAGANEPGLATRAEVDDSGTLMYLLIGASTPALVTKPGTYTFTLPKGFVQNADGELNQEQTVTVVVADVELAEGTVTPEDATFTVGEAVSFTITFEDTVTENPDFPAEDAPVLVTNYDDYDKKFTWDDDELTISGKSVVINLGSDLVAGNYEVSLIEGAVNVGDAINDVVVFNFTVQSSTTPPTTTALAEPVASPADGSVVSFGTMTLKWGLVEIKATSDAPVAYVSYNDGTEETPVDINVEYSRVETSDGYELGSATEAIIDWSNPTWTLGGGEYTIRIPAGTFQAYDDETVVNEELTYTYTLMNSYGKDVVIPAQSDYGTYYAASQLSAVTVAWEEKAEFVKVNEDLEITAVLEGNNSDTNPLALAAGEEAVTDGVLNPSLVTVNMTNGTIVLDLSELAPGSWTITIPAGYVYFDQYTVNSELPLVYNITNGLPSATMMQPYSSVVSTPVAVNLTWDYQTVSPTAKGLSATLTYFVANSDSDNAEMTATVDASLFSFFTVQAPSDDEGGIDQDPGDIPVGAADASGNVLSIDVVDLLKDAIGYVTLSLPEGIVATADGATNPAQEFQFQILPLSNVAATVEYDEATESLLVSWGDAEIYMTGNAGLAAITGDEEDIVLTPFSLENLDGRIYVNDTWDALVIDLEGLELEGNYALYLPEGYVNIEGSINQTVNFEFHFTEGVYGEGPAVPSGISAIEAEAVQGGVYNLQGVKVNADNLKPGIYVVNGKKVLVK